MSDYAETIGEMDRLVTKLNNGDRLTEEELQWVSAQYSLMRSMARALSDITMGIVKSAEKTLADMAKATLYSQENTTSE